MVLTGAILPPLPLPLPCHGPFLHSPASPVMVPPARGAALPATSPCVCSLTRSPRNLGCSPHIPSVSEAAANPTHSAYSRANAGERLWLGTVRCTRRAEHAGAHGAGVLGARMRALAAVASPAADCGSSRCFNTWFPSQRERRLLGRKVLHFYQSFQDSHKHIFGLALMNYLNAELLMPNT